MASNMVFDQKPQPTPNPRGPNIVRYVLAIAVSAAIIFGCSLMFWGTTTVTGWFNGVTVGEENYSYYDSKGYTTYPVITPADKAECFRRAWVIRRTLDQAGRPLTLVCFKPEGN